MLRQLVMPGCRCEPPKDLAHKVFIQQVFIEVLLCAKQVLELGMQRQVTER